MREAEHEQHPAASSLMSTWKDVLSIVWPAPVILSCRAHTTAHPVTDAGTCIGWEQTRRGTWCAIGRSIRALLCCCGRGRRNPRRSGAPAAARCPGLGHLCPALRVLARCKQLLRQDATAELQQMHGDIKHGCAVQHLSLTAAIYSHLPQSTGCREELPCPSRDIPAGQLEFAVCVWLQHISHTGAMQCTSRTLEPDDGTSCQQNPHASLARYQTLGRQGERTPLNGLTRSTQLREALEPGTPCSALSSRS